MFDISGWEFLALGIIAVLVFGPERLPKAAADAGRFARTVRQYVAGAKEDLSRELGPDFAQVKDLRAADLSPRGLLRKTFDGDDGLADLRKDLRKDLDELRSPLLREKPVRPLEANEVPPFDPETT